MARRCHFFLIGLTALIGADSAGFSQECARTQYCESQSAGQSERCCKKECRIRIPSFQIGFSFGCDKCGGCCLDDCCGKKKKCSYWEKLAPPEGPVVFSVPAMPVREQAIAVNPLTRSVEMRTERCDTGCSKDETELLLLLLLLQQQQQREAATAPRTAPESGVSRALEDRLLKMVEDQISSQIGR